MFPYLRLTTASPLIYLGAKRALERTIDLPNHKSNEKRMKTSAKERARNRGNRSTLRDAVRAVRTATKKADALKAYAQATVLLDKAASSGLIHKNNAARNKSRLAGFIAKLA